MRFKLSMFALILAAACGKSTTGPMGDDGQPDSNMMGSGGTPAFEIVSKDAVLQPGDQITYCYHTHTPNTSEVLVNKWVSDISPGSHHAIMFQLPQGDTTPDGTLDTSECGGLVGGSAPVWTYATQTEHQEMDLPADDGTGKPLAQKIAPNTAVVFQLHYLNATDNVLMAHIDLKAYGLPAGAAFTETDAYVTYQYNISVGPGAVGTTVTGSCPLPAGVKFWTVSTHSHKQSVETKVMDGSSMVFDSTMWEHPGAVTWMTPSTFYTFSNSKLTWSCTYNNNAPPPYCDQGGPQGTCSNADTTVQQGPSAVTNEMCMATGYFFPATGPKFGVALGSGSCMSL